jgi:hypothetical protein
LEGDELRKGWLAVLAQRKKIEFECHEGLEWISAPLNSKKNNAVKEAARIAFLEILDVNQ